jgi:hypothetical protein
MELLGAIVVDVGLCAFCGWLLWQRRKTKESEKRDAAIIDAQAGEIQAAHLILKLQSNVIYDMACQLHGKPAADRAIREAAKRGSN